MSSALSNSQIQTALSCLGLSPQDFQRIGTFPTYEERRQALTGLKATIKKQFRRAALALHPDRTGNDPDKTEQFKALARFVEEVEGLQVRPPAPPIQYMQFTTFSNSATGTSTSGFHWGTIRIVVR